MLKPMTSTPHIAKANINRLLEEDLAHQEKEKSQNQIMKCTPKVRQKHSKML